ncbi:hypothetical protein NFJ02_18g31930 [Pycnococcus provasolii]
MYVAAVSPPFLHARNLAEEADMYCTPLPHASSQRAQRRAKYRVPEELSLAVARPPSPANDTIKSKPTRCR